MEKLECLSISISNEGKEFAPNIADDREIYFCATNVMPSKNKLKNT